MITVLLTDIEGSTRLMESAPAAYREALMQHHEILREEVGRHGGREIQETGDGFYFVFDGVEAGARAALEAQRVLAGASWPDEIGPLKVRMALHAGEAEFRDGQYRGAVLHLAARLLAAANGGQTLCPGEIAAGLPVEAEPRRLGRFGVRGFDTAVDILQLDGRTIFPPLRLEHARKSNLPEEGSLFVGRESEMAELTRLLDPEAVSSRCLVITGPGGIGKSRLALAAAREVLLPYEHNVLFIALSEAVGAEAIPHAILSALGAKPADASNPAADVQRLLGSEPVLLVLDGLEGLGPHATGAVHSVLAQLPGAHVLATSRVCPGGLAEFPLGPMPVPPEGASDVGAFEAVRLLVERVRLNRPGFVLDPERAQTVAALCRSLGGIPLAIEVAAARLQVLSLEEVSRELLADADGLEPLVRVFEWSCGLLPPDVREFFLSLSVFRGGWTAAAAGEVADVSEHRLAVASLHFLLSCSLVRTSEFVGGMRFSMLEPIRALAEKRLNGSEPRRRHADWFARLAQKLDDAFGTEKESATAAQAEPETANFFVALRSIEEDEKRLQMAVWLQSFAVQRSCNEELRQELIRRNQPPDEVSPSRAGRAWHAVGALAGFARKPDEAREAFQKASDYFEQCGEEKGLVSSRFNLTLLAFEGVPSEEACQIALETADFFLARRDMAEYGTCLSCAANLERKLGKISSAKQRALECIGVCKEHGLPRSQAHCLETLGLCSLTEDHPAEAAAHFFESIRLCISLGHHRSLAELAAEFSIACEALSELSCAAFFVGAARSLCRQLNYSLCKESLDFLDRAEQGTIHSIGAEAFALHSERGAKAPLTHWLIEGKLESCKLNSGVQKIAKSA